MGLIDYIHERFVSDHRARVLSEYIAALLPPNSRVLDVGCGDGMIASLVARRRPDVSITGVDVLARDDARIEVIDFDGLSLPFETGAFDVVLLVDVLHHTDEPLVLLADAARVATQHLLIKDHTREGVLAGATLRFMDRVGNARYGVALPYNYWRRQQWLDAFASLHLEIENWHGRLNLYGWPARVVFERQLHFLAMLRPAGGTPK